MATFKYTQQHLPLWKKICFYITFSSGHHSGIPHNWEEWSKLLFISFSFILVILNLYCHWVRNLYAFLILLKTFAIFSFLCNAFLSGFCYFYWNGTLFEKSLPFIFFFITFYSISFVVPIGQWNSTIIFLIHFMDIHSFAKTWF